MELAQGGVARAEVVNAQLDAQLVQLLEGGDREVGVLHHHGLGDLQLQRARVEVRPLQGFLNPGREVTARELFAGEVDAQRKPPVGGGLPLPLARLAAGLFEHPLPEGDDEARLLGDGDEFRRENEPPVGVVEPHQRLRSGQGAGGEVDERLVVEPQPVVVEGPAEHGLRAERRRLEFLHSVANRVRAQVIAEEQMQLDPVGIDQRRSGAARARPRPSPSGDAR